MIFIPWPQFLYFFNLLLKFIMPYCNTFVEEALKSLLDSSNIGLILALALIYYHFSFKLFSWFLLQWVIFNSILNIVLIRFSNLLPI